MNTKVSALLAATLLIPGLADAINCRVTVAPLAFGIYNPGQATPVDSVANITVRCQAQPGTYAVTIGAGLSGDQLARTMLAGAGQVLNYNLYRDPARTQVWGDGTPPTFLVAGARIEKGRPTSYDHPIYGRIFGNQFPDPGTYTDTLLVTVLF